MFSLALLYFMLFLIVFLPLIGFLSGGLFGRFLGFGVCFLTTFNVFLSLVFSLRNYDVVWIEKEALPWTPYFIEKIFFLSVRPYIVDYDDAVFHWYDKSKNSFIKFLLGSKHQSLIRNAKLVIVGNSYLERYANRASAQKVLNLPTSIDFNKYSKFKDPTFI